MTQWPTRSRDSRLQRARRRPSVRRSLCRDTPTPVLLDSGRSAGSSERRKPLVKDTEHMCARSNGYERAFVDSRRTGAPECVRTMVSYRMDSSLQVAYALGRGHAWGRSSLPVQRGAILRAVS